MINWIKNKLGITALENENMKLKNQVILHKNFVINKIAELKEYTRVDADVGIRGNNTIILTGVYRKRAYVQFFDIGDGEFLNLVEQLKNMKKHALIRHIDSVPSFKGIFEI